MSERREWPVFYGDKQSGNGIYQERWKAENAIAKLRERFGGDKWHIMSRPVGEWETEDEAD